LLRSFAKKVRVHRAQVRAVSNAELRAKTAIVPDGRYGVIVIDPPWRHASPWG